MVALSLHDRLQPPARMLAWLVDESDGTATLQQLSGAAFGPKSLLRTIHYVKVMSQFGWLATEDGKDGRLASGRVTVTEPGYLWRDYFKHGKPEFTFNRIEDHAYRRAFALALEPLAKAGVEWREANESKRYRMQIGFEAIGISARQALIAAELLFPSGHTHVIYPWTPGYLNRRNTAITAKKHHTHGLPPVPR
jgi:hypothetical protein